jgi:hypothetical protein
LLLQSLPRLWASLLAVKPQKTQAKQLTPWLLKLTLLSTKPLKLLKALPTQLLKLLATLLKPQKKPLKLLKKQ